MFVARGDEMMVIKDVSAARKFYAYAANAGSARAALALARTYDPMYISQIGAIGLQPDPEMAQVWYRKAASLGDPNARDRIGMMDKQVVR
jgi:TPR repeat protein